MKAKHTPDRDSFVGILVSLTQGWQSRLMGVTDIDKKVELYMLQEKVRLFLYQEFGVSGVDVLTDKSQFVSTLSLLDSMNESELRQVKIRLDICEQTVQKKKAEDV